MPRAYPRYTTYLPGELDAALRRLSPQHFAEGGLNPAVLPTVHGSGSRLIHEHTLGISFPDGTEGTCRYVRKAPNFHQFFYDHTSPLDGFTTTLPVTALFERMQNTVVAIEEAMHTRTTAAFASAVEWEKRDYFRRATLPQDKSRTIDAALFQMTARQAKKDAGTYAVCVRIGRKYLPVVIRAFGCLEEANAAWRNIARPNTTVCGLSRLDRAWKPLRFNPAYADLMPSIRSEDIRR